MKGVTVYPRIKEIVAEKPDGSLWRHKFTRRASIIGKPDGSLSIRGAAGQRLHKRFPYEGRSEPFLINPPAARTRRNYAETQEPRTAEIWKAPKHRAAALAGWLFRDRAAERKARPRTGLAKRRRHGKQPANLAAWHAHETRGRMRRAGVGGGQLAVNRPRRRARKNPLLQILNPPSGGSKMRRSKKRMPAGLARYWASRRAAKKSRSNPAMAKRRRKAHTKRRRHTLVAANPRTRRHARRHARRHVRRNPPGIFRALNMDLLKDGAAVAGGIVLPQLALRVPQLEQFANTKMKRGLVKVGAALALSQLARKFVGPRAANLLLVGAAANLLLDALPTVAPKLGLGLADSYDPEQFPMLSEMHGLNPGRGMYAAEYNRAESLEEMGGY